MSWNTPGNKHRIKVGWWESHEEISEPHTSKQLEQWFNENHKCIDCKNIIRSHHQASYDCLEKETKADR